MALAERNFWFLRWPRLFRTPGSLSVPLLKDRMGEPDARVHRLVDPAWCIEALCTLGFCDVDVVPGAPVRAGWMHGVPDHRDEFGFTVEFAESESESEWDDESESEWDDESESEWDDESESESEDDYWDMFDGPNTSASYGSGSYGAAALAFYMSVGGFVRADNAQGLTAYRSGSWAFIPYACPYTVWPDFYALSLYRLCDMSIAVSLLLNNFTRTAAYSYNSDGGYGPSFADVTWASPFAGPGVALYRAFGDGYNSLSGTGISGDSAFPGLVYCRDSSCPVSVLGGLRQFAADHLGTPPGGYDQRSPEVFRAPTGYGYMTTAEVHARGLDYGSLDAADGHPYCALRESGMTAIGGNLTQSLLYWTEMALSRVRTVRCPGFTSVAYDLNLSADQVSDWVQEYRKWRDSDGSEVPSSDLASDLESFKSRLGGGFYLLLDDVGYLGSGYDCHDGSPREVYSGHVRRSFRARASSGKLRFHLQGRAAAHFGRRYALVVEVSEYVELFSYLQKRVWCDNSDHPPSSDAQQVGGGRSIYVRTELKFVNGVAELRISDLVDLVLGAAAALSDRWTSQSSGGRLVLADLYGDVLDDPVELAGSLASDGQARQYSESYVYHYIYLRGLELFADFASGDLVL